MLTRYGASQETEHPKAGQLPQPVHTAGSLSTPEGRVAALAVLIAFEDERHLPHPLEIDPVAVMDRVDVHLESPAQLAEWAAAMDAPIRRAGRAVVETCLLLAGHRYDLWARYTPAEIDAQVAAAAALLAGTEPTR